MSSLSSSRGLKPVQHRLLRTTPSLQCRRRYTKPCVAFKEQSVKPGNGKDAVVQAPTISVPSLQTAESTESKEQRFVWSKNWFPIVPVEYLDSKRPYAFSLLGKELVLWRDNAGQWSCFDDKCPHRMAPLSEGRVENDGTLSCCYHGWRFNAAGRCTAIPQASDNEQAAVSSKRACVQTFPCQEREGLIWVWPDASPSAVADSAKETVPVVEGLDDREWLVHGSWFIRDMPYSYDMLLENVVDPTHVPFIHHGLSGVDRKDGLPLNISTVKSLDVKEGFINRRGDKSTTETTVTFLPPTAVLAHSINHKGFQMQYEFFGIPTTPGKSRVFSRVRFGGLPKNFLTAAFRAISPLMIPIAHLRDLQFLDGDTLLLAEAENVVRRNGGYLAPRYFIPTASDAPVLDFRKWCKMAGEIPWPKWLTGPAPFTPAEASREQLLDRYRTHVSQCPHCKSALASVKRGQTVLRAAAVAAAAALAYMLPSLQPHHFAIAAVAALLTWRLDRQLSIWESRFYWRDYVHAYRD